MKQSVMSLVLLAFLVSALNGCGDRGKSTEDYITRARSYQDQGDYKAAVIELKNALRESPDNAEARLVIGTVYLNSGDGASAEKELQRSVELGAVPQKVIIPLLKAQLLQGKFKDVLDSTIDTQSLEAGEQVMLLLLRGDAQMGLGELDAADALYDEALVLQPDLAEAGLGKARVAIVGGNFTKARELVEGVIRSRDDFAPAWSLLADLEQQEGNMAAAEVAYGKAIGLRPENAYDLASRAMMRLALDNLPGAKSDVGAAMRAPMHSPGVQPLVAYARGRLALTEKNFADASNQFEKTLKLTPDYLPARYFLAVAQYRLGQFEQAGQNLGIFRYKAPQFTGGHRLFAAVKYSQGEYDVAQQELENLLSFDPDDTWALDLLADIAVMKGNPDQSIENYRKIVALHPDSGEALVNLGLGLMITESGEARQVLTEAAAAENASLQAKMLLVVSYMKASEWEEAVVAAEGLIAADAGNWDAFTLLGGAYLGKGDTEKAREKFEQALKLNPGNPNATSNLARLELKAGNRSAARRLYEQVLEHYPTEVPTLLSLGALDYSEGKFQDAVERIEIGLSKNPQDLSLRLALARLYLRTGQPSRNLNLVYEAPEAQANHPLMLQVLGDSQSALGDFGAAVASYEKVVGLAPESATAHYLLARAYASNNKLERAEQQLQKVIQLEPDHLAASVMRVRLLRLDRKEQEALQLLKEIDPQYLDRPEILVEKGWLALYQRQYAEATQAFERAFELVPSNDLVIQLGIARWNSGDEVGALEGYKSWLTANPTDAQVMFHLANGYLQLGRNDEAVVAFQKLLDQKPDNPIVMNNLAWLLRDSDPKQALKLAERTTNIAPQWASGIDTLGVILLGQGDTKQAYRHFEQALKQSPEDPQIRYHLALASSRMGENEQAQQILKAILAEPGADFEGKQDAEKLLLSLKE